MSSAADALLAAQRAAGNRAVARYLVQRVTASTADSKLHAEARAAHEEDRQALRDIVEKNQASSDQTLANSCRWYLTGRSKLYALTPTADSADRAKLASHEGELAMFGESADVLVKEPASYNENDMEDVAGITFVPPASGGFRRPTGGKVYITQPARRDALNEFRKQSDSGTFDPVTDALKHETQHEADVDFTNEFVDSRTKADTALAMYRTEFRAYTAQAPAWLGEDLKPSDEHFGDFEWPDKIQLRIFLHIYKGYQAVTTAWDKDATLRDGTPFRTAVRAMHGTITEISSNPRNSPELDEFWGMLNSRTIQPEHAAALLAAQQRLTSEDNDALRRSSRLWKQALAEPWQEDAVEALVGSNYPAFEKIMEVERLERAKRQEEEAAARRKRPPRFADLEKYVTSWDELARCARDAKMDEDLLNDELDMWQDQGWKPDVVDAFLGNTSVGSDPNGVDWWTILNGLAEVQK